MVTSGKLTPEESGPGALFRLTREIPLIPELIKCGSPGIVTFFVDTGGERVFLGVRAG